MKLKFRVRSWVRAKRTLILLAAIALGLMEVIWVTKVARDAQGVQEASTRAREVGFRPPPGPLDRFL